MKWLLFIVKAWKLRGYIAALYKDVLETIDVLKEGLEGNGKLGKHRTQRIIKELRDDLGKLNDLIEQI